MLGRSTLSQSLSYPNLVVCGRLGQRVWSWTVFSKLLTVIAKKILMSHDCLLVSQCCLSKKQMLRVESIFVMHLKVKIQGRLCFFIIHKIHFNFKDIISFFFLLP